MSVSPLPSAVQGEGPSLLDSPKPSNQLITFPPEATLKRIASSEAEVHVSEVVSGDGIHVIATFRDLVDHRVAMQTLTGKIANANIAVHILAGEPRSYADAFRSYVHYALRIGGAKNILTPSRDLATLLDVHTARDPENRLRNGLLLVVDGSIVWKSVASALRPNDMTHDLDGLKTAIAHHRAQLDYNK